MGTTSPGRSLAPYSALRLLGQGAEVLGWVLLSRRLGDDALGQLAVASLACRFGGLVADWGASLTGSGSVAAHGLTPNHQTLIDLRVRLSLVLASLYVAVVLAAGRPELAPIAGQILLRGMARDWVALGRHRGVTSAVPLAIGGLVFVAGAAIATSVATAAIGIGLASAVGLGLSVIGNPVPGRGTSAGRDGPSLAGWALLIALADQVYVSSDTFLLAGLRSSADAGIYNLLYRIPNAWVTVVGIVVAAALPGVTVALTREPHTIAQLRRRALRIGTRAACTLLLVTPALVWAVGPVLGPSFTAGRPALVILLISTAAKTATAPLQPIYLATRSPRGLAGCLAAAATFNLAANAIAIPRWGMTGAAATTLIAELFLTRHLLVRTRSGRIERGMSVLAPTERPEVDVVILTWNDGPLLERAIDSAVRSIDVDVTVIVVDNGSDPPATPGHGVDRLLRNDRNRGVAAARNQGVMAGGSPIVCLLDSDAELEPTCLRQLVDALTSQPPVAMAAPVFVDQRAEASAGSAPTLVRKLTRLAGITDSYAPAARRTEEQAWPVDFAIGACQVFRREAFLTVDGIDERYFYGPEDVDFCLRLRRAGYDILQVGEASCHHPPRRRNRSVFTRRGLHHAGTVARHLWRHRGFRAGDGRVIRAQSGVSRHHPDGPSDPTRHSDHAI